MNFLRDRWRRTAFHQYFEGLDRGDRATFWIVTALALALGVSITAITRPAEAPGINPVILDFDAARASVPA